MDIPTTLSSCSSCGLFTPWGGAFQSNAAGSLEVFEVFREFDIDGDGCLQPQVHNPSTPLLHRERENSEALLKNSRCS